MTTNKVFAAVKRSRSHNLRSSSTTLSRIATASQFDPVFLREIDEKDKQEPSTREEKEKANEKNWRFQKTIDITRVKVGVKKVANIKKGGIIIETVNEEDLDKLLKELEDNARVKDKFTVGKEPTVYLLRSVGRYRRSNCQQMHQTALRTTGGQQRHQGCSFLQE
ncbi:hypothetical protein CDAR_464471 [Caerostris darwini]|uniref:Uncharacterized protein n=1 Tax=Caerostris darwini TaxID=1538125 RepID=A0AAV4VUZ2_9ARAC|nr:hypothetical protein CDAR_464471 [Caerostris darwini]